MTTANTTPGAHPVVAAVACLHAQLDDLDATFWTMTEQDFAATLPALTRLRQRVTSLELSTAHAANTIGLGTEVGAADTGAYWANATRQPKGIAKHRLKLAAALDKHETTRVAMAQGSVAEDQAVVIIEAVDALPARQHEAETHLVALATEHDATALAILGKHVLEVVAPDLADQHLQRTLEREEERAQETCRLTITDDGHGTATIRGKVPSVVGAMIKKHLLVINAPKVRARTLSPQGMGHAFCEYVTRYPLHALPQGGGVDATLVVTMTMETLRDNAPATLETGQQVTASYARKLACEAGIIPVVLGGKSVVLDQGRKARFHTEPQRIALNTRDKTCTALGCDWPAWLCHAHHDQPWAQGGHTNIETGRLLCPRHHQYAHSPTYEMKKTKHGRVVFTRR